MGGQLWWPSRVAVLKMRERDWIGDGAVKLVMFGAQGKYQMSRGGRREGGRPAVPSPPFSL
jgi:hypothetical protein